MGMLFSPTTNSIYKVQVWNSEYGLGTSAGSLCAWWNQYVSLGQMGLGMWGRIGVGEEKERGSRLSISSFFSTLLFSLLISLTSRAFYSCNTNQDYNTYFYYLQGL